VLGRLGFEACHSFKLCPEVGYNPLLIRERWAEKRKSSEDALKKYALLTLPLSRPWCAGRRRRAAR
jgi:hypothetical protein